MKFFFFLLSTLLTSYSFAGGVTVGNGGNSVICKDSLAQVTKAEIFDLYEGRVLKGLSFKESSTPYLDQARGIALNLSRVMNLLPDNEGGPVNLLEENIKHLVFLPSGTGLKPVPDGAEFILPKGCELTQTANFHDFEHIYVDSDIWSILSETQKAALLIHETVYEFLRDTGPKGSAVEVNSIRARRAVALLFAGVQFINTKNFESSSGQNPVRCSTDEALEADRPSSFFYIYPQQDGRVTFQFLQFRDRQVITRTSLTSVPTNISAWPKRQTDQPFSASGDLDSLIDSDSYIGVDWWPNSPQHNRIFVRDLDGNTSFESFNCDLRNQ